MTANSSLTKTISKLLFIFFLITSFCACQKDLSTKVIPPDSSIEETSRKVPGKKPIDYTVMDGPSSDYFSFFNDLFNGSYAVYAVAISAPHHIYKWELVKNGILISSTNVDIYDGINGVPTYLTTISNPTSGTYTLRIYTNAVYTGSGWLGYDPTGLSPFESTESILQTNTTGTVNIYRYWSSYNTDHFYTKTKTYYKDYQFENIEWVASAGGGGGLAPFYRYWNPSIKDHFYTTTSGSYSGYTYETVEGYVLPYSSPGFVPLYRYWNASIKDHFYTVTPGTYSGYVSEGIAGYVQ